MAGSSLDHPESAAEAVSPFVAEPNSSPRVNMTLSMANRAKFSVRRHKKAQASQHDVVPKPSPSTSAHPAIQAPNVLYTEDEKAAGDLVLGYLLEPRPGEKSINFQ